MRDEFDQLAKAIVSSLCRFEMHGLYVQFVETVSRELATTLNDPLDVKKIASSLSAVANEKQRIIKEKETKKKKGICFLSVNGDVGSTKSLFVSAPIKKALNRSEDIYDDVAIEGGGAGGAYDDEVDFM